MDFLLHYLRIIEFYRIQIYFARLSGITITFYTYIYYYPDLKK